MKLIHFISVLALTACASNIPRHVDNIASDYCKQHAGVKEVIPYNSLYQESGYIYKIKCNDNSTFIWTSKEK